MQLIAREDFIEFSGPESSRSYIWFVLILKIKYTSIYAFHIVKNLYLSYMIFIRECISSFVLLSFL